MDVDARLAEAVRAYGSSDLETAHAACRDVLTANPEHPDGLHFLAILVFNQGEHEDAILYLQRSLELNGRNAAAHNNLGNMLKVIGRRDDALSEYVRAVEVDPDLSDAWRNMSMLMGGAGKFDDHLPVLADITDRHPGNGDAWRAYGLALKRAGRREAAADAFDRGLTIGFEPLAAAVRTARYLHLLGREDRAIEHLAALSASHPEDPSAAFHLAAARGEALDKAPADYVKSHFDGFASSFDDVLKGLRYQAPDRVAEFARTLADQAGKPFSDVADLGCGTGLTGPLVRDICQRLTGIDLSPGMLQKAAAREVYDYLLEGDLVAFLNSDLPVRFDLCLCVDTLIYFGDLAPFFDGLARALAPGGVLIASVEELEEGAGAYRLHPGGRYAHGVDYLRQTVEAAGLQFGPEQEIILRKEFGRDVTGLVFQVRKPD